MKKPILLVACLLAALAGGAVQVPLVNCGPFTDVSPAFCPFVAKLYYLGITAGTSPTTFSPDQPITRGQAAVFVSKGIDASIQRSSRRAALRQWWTPQSPQALALTSLPGAFMVGSDGADLWVSGGTTVSRVRASDGKLLDTWTGGQNALSVLVALGRVFVTGTNDPGKLYSIDPGLPAGSVTEVAGDLGKYPFGATFDGTRIWTANGGYFGAGGSVSIITPGPTLPWSVTTVTTGFEGPYGIEWDGHNIWVGDVRRGQLLRLDANGTITQALTLAPLGSPVAPVFDGTNLWVADSVLSNLYVVRPSDGTLLATLSGNGLDQPNLLAFDGERILVASPLGRTVSLWRAKDFAPLGFLATGSSSLPFGVCSDGRHFWFVLSGTQLARYG